MSSGLTRDLSKFTLEDIPVSKHVIEMLDLEVGQQTRLIAARKYLRWKCVDQVMCTARAWKERRYVGFVRNFKFCYDDADRTVYCLVHDSHICDSYCAFATHVGEDTVVFYKVNSIVERNNSSTPYLHADIRIRVSFFFVSSTFFSGVSLTCYCFC